MLPGGQKAATKATQEEDFSAFPHRTRSTLSAPRFQPNLQCASGAQPEGSNTSDPRPRVRVQDALPPAQATGHNPLTQHQAHATPMFAFTGSLQLLIALEEN